MDVKTTKSTATIQMGRMAAISDTLPVPEIMKDFIKDKAEQFSNNLYTAHCFNSTKDGCQTPLSELSYEENELWKIEIEEVLTYIIMEYIRDRDKDIKIVQINCKQLICEILISLNLSPYPNISNNEIQQTTARFYRYLNDSPYLDLKNLYNSGWGIHQGIPSDTQPDIYYEYLLIIFNEGAAS